MQPILWAVPRISFTHPDSSFASDFDFITRDMSRISSNVTLPECLMFFSFFRSRGGSREGVTTSRRYQLYDIPLRARITKDEAEGTTATVACRFWIVNWTVTRRPFHCDVALAMSSPTFFGDCNRSSVSENSGKCIYICAPDQEDQFWELVQTTHQPHHQLRAGR